MGMDASEALSPSAVWHQSCMGKRFLLKPLLRLTVGSTSEIPMDVAVGRSS